MTQEQATAKRASTERLFALLRRAPWWAIIIAIIGTIVFFSVLTDARYRDAMYFLFDLPWNKELIAEIPIESDTWTFSPDERLPLQPGLYRLFAEFQEVTADIKRDGPIYSEPDATSQQVGQLAEGDAVSLIKWKIIPKSGLKMEQRWVLVRTDGGAQGWIDARQLGRQDRRTVQVSDIYTIEIPEGAQPVQSEPIMTPTGETPIVVRSTMPTLIGSVPAGSLVMLYNKYDLNQTLHRAWTSKGVFLTLRSTILGFALALILGLVTGLMLVSRNPVTLAISKLYVELVRGIPLLVIILYAGFVIAPYIREATDGKIDLGGFSGAVIGLGFGYGAYLAEVFRAGIQSIHRGQMEAARSLGMTYFQAMQHIVLPQAFRVILPPLGNDFMAMLKDSSLISVVALPEILQQGRLWVSRTFRAFEGYNTVALFYLVMTLLLSLLVRLIERRTSLPGQSED